MDRVARRLELLKLEGLGFSRAEVVNELSQKMSCTKRAVYKDFETREVWQPSLQSVVEPKAVLMKIITRYEQIYRQASMRFLTTSNELAKMATLNTMLKVNSLMFDTAVLLDCQGIGVGKRLLNFVAELYISQTKMPFLPSNQ